MSAHMDGKLKAVTLFLFVFLVCFFKTNNLHAKTGEISFLAMYSKTTYGDNAYSTSRRYTMSAGYLLTKVSQIEVSFSSEASFMKQQEFQTISTIEQSLTASLVQTLVPPDWYFQPYVKAGAAQYNRKQNGTIAGIPTREVYTKSPSFVLGVGARVYFLDDFSFKVEVTEVFPNFTPKEGKNNISAEAGLSWNF